MKTTIAALAGLLFATHAVAEGARNSSYFIKARALKEACIAMDGYGRKQGEVTNDGVFASGRCYGAILGILDAITLGPMISSGKIKAVEFCLPPEMAANDVAMRLATEISQMKAAKGVPVEVAENGPAYLIVLEAARSAFPCTM